MTKPKRTKTMKKADPEILTKRHGPPRPCVCCGEIGYVEARGLIVKCYSRCKRFGTRERWPITSRRNQACVVLSREFAVSRAELYRELTTGPGAISRKRACIVLNITERTAYRYQAWMRAQKELDVKGG